MNNKERITSIKMSGDKCEYSGSTSVLDCHCNDCRNHIIEYLGKRKGKKYLYTGDFKDTIKNREVIIISFSTDGDNENNSCECFVRRADSEYCYEWIPREDIIGNLVEINDAKCVEDVE